MLKRFVPVFRIVCLALGGVLLYQVGSLALHRDPLAGVRVPTTLTVANTAAEPAAAPKTNAVTGPWPAPKPPELSAAVQARVDRIVQSEILGPVMRPPPMGLLGIAGKDV